MPRRPWLSAALLAAGAGLLATARLAGASPPSAGVFRVGMEGASVQIDPQVSYISTGWWLEYATAAKLYNWTDRGSHLVPEVASRVAISKNGHTYTFFLRKGFRFSDGSPVTARNFVYAFQRATNPELQSPAAGFIAGLSVRAKGSYKLVIHLTQPDPSFLFTLTTPFFQATSTALPLTQEVTTAYPSAGPYYFSVNDVNTLTSIRRNPYYRGGRPRHVAGVDITWNLDQHTAFQQVLANQLDEAAVPTSDAQDAARQFGVNRTRFWVEPLDCVGSLLFNARRGVLDGNPAMRKAVSWAVDRTAYAAQAGAYAGSPWTHLLPPRFPGSIDAKRLQPYAPTSRITRARRLAAGHFRSGKINVTYSSRAPAGPAEAGIVRRDLIRLGFKAANVEIERFACGPEGCAPAADWDVLTSWGMCAVAPDPFSLFGPFTVQRGAGPIFSLGSPKYERRLLAATKLSGEARLKAFGKLDLDVMKNVAPIAVMKTYNNRYLVSNRVDRRSLAFNGVYRDWSIPALRLK